MSHAAASGVVVVCAAAAARNSTFSALGGNVIEAGCVTRLSIYVFVCCLNSQAGEEIRLSQQLRRRFTMEVESS